MVSPSATMAHCPFCKQSITPELAQYGGNCPKCMLEIPGEEAPTDPGAHVRARLNAEQQVVHEKQRQKRWVGWAIGAGLLVSFVGFGAWKLKQERDALTYNLDEYYVMPLEDIVVAAAPVVEPDAVASADPKPEGGGSTRQRPIANPSATVAAPESVGSTGVRASSSSTDALPPELAAAMAATGGSASLGGADIAVVRPDVVLSDPAEIKAMIGRVLAGSRPQLNACYQQRLKQAENLRGTWDLQFTVSTAGVATGVDARGRDRADGELEACMERAVAGWRFSKVARPVGPVQVPFQFSAS